MTKTEDLGERTVISKWKKKPNGLSMEMVVYKKKDGKRTRSITRHEQVKIKKEK